MTARSAASPCSARRLTRSALISSAIEVRFVAVQYAIGATRCDAHLLRAMSARALFVSIAPLAQLTILVAVATAVAAGFRTVSDAVRTARLLADLVTDALGADSPA